MKRETRIIFATIVLLVGLIVAALFQPPAQSEPEKANTEVAVLQPSYSQTVSYVKKVPIPEVITPQKIDVPDLPTPESILPIPAESRTVEEESSLSASRTAKDDPVPELPANFPSPKKPLQPEPKKRIHTIVDGDTLRGLAFRYLDNESRWNEIYLANRDVLEDPMSLPIGEKLAIPPRALPSQLKHASQSRVFPASTERPASRLTQRSMPSQTQPYTQSPVVHNAAKPVEKPLEVLPNKPMVPMTE